MPPLARTTRTNARDALFALFALFATSGCAAQLTGGPVFTPGAPRALWGAGALAVRTFPARGIGPALGARAAFSVDADRRVFAWRNVEANAGVLVPPRRLGGLGLGFEATLDVGLGQPESGWTAPAPGPGVYTGASALLVLRVVGPSEPRPLLIGARVSVDFLLGGRAGVWSPPESAALAPVGVVSLDAGLRVGLVSDLLAYEPAGRRP